MTNQPVALCVIRHRDTAFFAFHRLAAAFAYLSVSEMDKVSIYAIRGGSLEEVAVGIVGKDSYLNCIGRLNAIEFDSDSRISEAIVPSPVGRGDGYSIIISDFLP